MNTICHHLLIVLEQHLCLYEELSATIEAEKTALIDLNLPRLQELAVTKEEIARRIQEQVTPLAEKIEELALALRLPIEPLPTLAALAAALPKPWAGQVYRAAANLTRIKRQVSRDNQANHLFVQESLKIINGSIAILTGAATTVAKSGYLPNGQRAKGTGTRPIRLSREV